VDTGLSQQGVRVIKMWLSRLMPLITCGCIDHLGTIDDSAVILPLLRLVRKGDKYPPDAEGNTWSVYEPLAANWEGPWG
jgi:hypothetical protein